MGQVRCIASLPEPVVLATAACCSLVHGAFVALCPVACLLAASLRAFPIFMQRISHSLCALCVSSQWREACCGKKVRPLPPPGRADSFRRRQRKLDIADDDD
jgi:hypothetical protein